MDKESLRMPTASVTSAMYTVYPVNFRTTLDGPTDVLTTIFTIKGLWIDFVMDKESLRMPTASVTSSMYPVTFRTTLDGPTDGPTDVPTRLTTNFTIKGEYSYQLWISSTIKEKEERILHLYCHSERDTI